MNETMLSVGIDIGTSTTQLVISRLHIVNQAAAFTVPKIAITDKEILFKSDIHFTPLLSDTVIDTDGVRAIVAEEYRRSGIPKEQIQTGAVIITGETARKENAREVLAALSGFAGDFVVATAGPDLESILAARGAGADEYSGTHHCAVLHFDIGGGTSNLALFQNGELADTGCLNVGGRLLKLTPDGVLTYVSPVLSERFPLRPGQTVTEAQLQPVIAELVQALEQAAGLRPAGELLAHYLTNKTVTLPAEPLTLSFSGGVADCIYAPPDNWLAYGDIGVLLGRAIAASPLLSGRHTCGRETIRATVVGAGSHTTDLTGSTIAYAAEALPRKNLPVVSLTAEESASRSLPAVLQKKLDWHREDGALPELVVALPGMKSPSFAAVQQLADLLAAGLAEYGPRPVYIALEADMGKVLGLCLQPLLSGPLVCMDGLQLKTGQYLDVGTPVGGGAVLPVVIKTLIFTS